MNLFKLDTVDTDIIACIKPERALSDSTGSSSDSLKMTFFFTIFTLIDTSIHCPLYGNREYHGKIFKSDLNFRSGDSSFLLCEWVQGGVVGITLVTHQSSLRYNSWKELNWGISLGIFLVGV